MEATLDNTDASSMAKDVFTSKTLHHYALINYRTKTILVCKSFSQAIQKPTDKNKRKRVFK